VYHLDNCRVSDEGVKHILRMQQLTELRLGACAEEADGNSNTFTAVGFTKVLRALDTMSKLTVLDMQLPHVKELSIRCWGMYLLWNLEMGKRGALFVVQNMKDLTKLYIGKQWNDSDDSNLGDEGAITIAKSLINLNILYISKQ
jgi:hypothetical protein